MNFLFFIFCSVLSSQTHGASAPSTQARVTVYFIRHANSVWNEATDVFSERRSDKSAISHAKNLVVGAFKSVRGFAQGGFRDAHLSAAGKQQAKDLAFWLETQCPADRSNVLVDARQWNSDACVLNRPNENVPLIASNLKRTHETLIIGLQNRLNQGVGSGSERKFETINVLRDLQELGCKTDAKPKNDAQKFLPEREKCHCEFNTMTLDHDPLFRQLSPAPPESGQGNIQVRNEMSDTCATKKRHEITSFLSVVYSLFVMNKHHGKGKFVIVGHSHWIRHFMQHMLKPTNEVGESLKTKKIPNTAVIKFDLIAYMNEEGQIDIKSAKVDPESVAWVFKPETEDYVADDEEEDLGPDDDVPEEGGTNQHEYVV